MQRPDKVRRAASVAFVVLAVLTGACRQSPIHVHGRLIDRSDGHPVRGRLVPTDLPPFVTSDDGAFNFQIPGLDGNRAVRIEAVGYGSLALGASSLNGEDVRLVHTERLDGVLRYASGTPVANAEIYSAAKLDDAETKFEPESIVAHTSSDGSFAFDGYPPPTRWVVRANGMVIATPFLENANAVGRRSTVVIPDLGSLRVTVTKQGAPFASARVRVASSTHGFVFALTGSDGSVVVNGLPPTEFNVSTAVQAEGAQAVRATIVSGREVPVNLSTR